MSLTLSTIRKGQFIAVIAIALSLCLPTPSYAIFGLERSRLLSQADETYAAAQQAGAEGRVLDEISVLTEARTLYGRVLKEHAGYKTEYVNSRFQRCDAHLRIIHSRIKSGEISIPDPDKIVDGAGTGYVSENAIERSAPTPSQPDFISPMPPLVSSERKKPTPANADPALTTQAQLPPEKSATPADFSKKMLSPTAIVNAKTSDDDRPPSSTKTEFAKSNDTLRVMLINELFSAKNAAEAVMLLEEVIEKEGDAASRTTRILHVRALLECRNYKRAETELNSLMLDATPTAAMRSLASALALQKGNLTEAMFQVDRLIQDFPAYSDAYVNMAYLYYMMDPVANREMAIVCYRMALSYGAKRDPAFETALGVEIVK